MKLSVCQRVKLAVDRGIHRTRLWIKFKLARRRHEAPFFLLSFARAGSNLFADHLRSVPGVAMRWEILHTTYRAGAPACDHDKEKARAAALRHVQRSIETLDGRVAGAKLAFNHMERHNVTVDDIRGLYPKARFIILYRRSLAHQFVSFRVAKNTRQWTARSGSDVRRRKMTIRPEDFLAFRERMVGYHEGLLARPWLKDCSILLNYEDYTADPQRQFDEIISPFLGLPPVRIASTLKKLNPADLSQSVKNYEEVRELLTGEMSRVEFRFKNGGA